jgi:CRP-like cAMP-binding protein
VQFNKEILSCFYHQNHKMKSHYLKLEKLFKDLDKNAGEDYHQVFKKEELGKGTFLLKEGNICKYTWILETGLTRVFSTKNDIEITTYFGFPGAFIDSFRSYILQEPSKESIQLLEDSVVYSIRRSDIEHLKKKYPQINEIDKLLTECYVIWLEERIYAIQFSTAQERYNELINNYPLFIKKIPLTYIASYLGITLETLSRIRAKIK